MVSNQIASIIIPSYNNFKYIVETLDSVIAQTYPYWEAIVIDDGSTDGTQGFIKQYALQDNRIKFLQRESRDKGASVCRNIGIINSRGKYIIFLDADDLLAPFCLQRRIEFIEKYSSLDFAVFQMISLSGKEINEKRLTKKSDNYLFSFLRHDLPWAISCPIWKFDFIKKLKGFKDYYPRLQDPEIHTRALLEDGVKYKVLHNSEPDCFYRQGLGKVNLEHLLEGFALYINEFGNLINQRSDAELCRFNLNICRKAGLNHLFRRFDGKNRLKIFSLALKINSLAKNHSLTTKKKYTLSFLLLLSFWYTSLINLSQVRWPHQKVLNKLL